MLYGDFRTTKPDPTELKDARKHARLSLQEAADLCGMHRTTFARQETGESKVSLAAYRLILMHSGWLPDPFDGWSIGQGKLWTPEDVSFSPGQIRAIPIQYALIAEYRRKERLRNNHPEYTNVIPFRR